MVEGILLLKKCQVEREELYSGQPFYPAEPTRDTMHYPQHNLVPLEWKENLLKVDGCTFLTRTRERKLRTTWMSVSIDMYDIEPEGIRLELRYGLGPSNFVPAPCYLTIDIISDILGKEGKQKREAFKRRLFETHLGLEGRIEEARNVPEPSFLH